MNRRECLTTLAASVTTVLFPRLAWAADLPRDITITRIVAFDLMSKRPKFVGKNSQRDDHGDRSSDRIVRLYTNAGLEGIGICRAGEKAIRSLLGKNPFEFFLADEPAMKSPLGAGSMPLWDLAGKALGKPVFELLGGKGPAQVPVYDGSIYLADLLPQFADKPLDRFKAEIDLGFQRGHRAFKIKIGRGFKWMPEAEGYQRDKAVLSTIRQHTGPDILLGVDANNGYDLARTKRLLAELPDFNFAFVEEMFPEKVEQNLELKEFIRSNRLKTLVADGESQSTLEPFRPFMEARAIDIYQGDMNHFGLEGILQEAAMARPNGGTVAPHNWGSLLGFYLQLHVGRAITNFYRAENDPLDNQILIADGYSIQDGLATVPEAPGFGLKLHPDKFAANIKPTLDI